MSQSINKVMQFDNILLNNRGKLNRKNKQDITYSSAILGSVTEARSKPGGLSSSSSYFSHLLPLISMKLLAAAGGARAPLLDLFLIGVL
jgi:hypothetical protein